MKQGAGQEERGQAARAGAEAPEGIGWGLIALMDEWAHGVLVTTLGGRLLHANQAGRRELAAGLVLDARGGQVEAVAAESAAHLNEALMKVARGKRSLVTLHGAPGAQLSVAVLPLKRPQRDTPAGAALVFARASVCDSLMLTFFARTHGLTPAEEQVLGVLCQGYSAPEAAQQLRVAVSTVRSHVRSVCAKTGAGGMRELVSRVAVLPPVAPFWQEPMH